jgi:adenine-specific DNA glycosylase
MLQQTRFAESLLYCIIVPRVQTVIEYYQKWMKKWPTVNDLATATLEVKKKYISIEIKNNFQRK